MYANLKIISTAFAISIFILTLISACDQEEVSPRYKHPTPYSFPGITHFPTDLNIPEDNPMTEEGIYLGRFLFYDGRLSGSTHPDSLMSCATCHIQSSGFGVGTDHPEFEDGHPRGLPTPEFPNGKPTPHVVLPLVNLVYNSNGYLWNGFIHTSNERNTLPGYDFGGHEVHFQNIESLIWMSIVAEHEINGSINKTISCLSTDPMYSPLFEKAFGSAEINIDRISKAIAQFVRSIISYRSRFHQWIRHETELTEQELRGHNLFFSEEADCFHCHGGTALLTNSEYFNNAKDTSFTDDRDRYAVTGNPNDIGAYRAPSLVNVELNGPYMHDGRYKTLDEVINFYSEGLVYSEHVHPLMKSVRQGGVRLTALQKADLKAFLLTFTDDALLKDPQYQAPPELYRWLTR